MALPWNKQVLASYWIPWVGIGQNPMEKVVVPLTDIEKYVLPTGQPQTNIVFLGFATFTGTPQNFDPPYISISDDLVAQMTQQPGQRETNVQYLQSLGIKVLLSVQGYNTDGRPGMGWDGVPPGKRKDFALWVKTAIIDKYGLDGIDIDNEFSNLRSDPQSFVDTVSVLRGYLPNQFLSKALWRDTDYFTTPVTGGQVYLSSLLDFGATMGYGNGYQDQISGVEEYVTLKSGSLNVGMKPTQLCIGVQAGPPEVDWMTAIGETGQLARWVVQNSYLGMMLFTFPQDIQQWTHWPQNSPGYGFPNPNDHEWQKAIIAGIWGASGSAAGQGQY
jgi:hypothetical protein